MPEQMNHSATYFGQAFVPAILLFADAANLQRREEGKTGSAHRRAVTAKWKRQFREKPSS
jgi:hypothetical protein